MKNLMDCQICASQTSTVPSKERNVSCGDYFEGRRLYPVNLGEIQLQECHRCGFAVFGEMQAWTEDRFRSEIYNDDYHLCDPPFREERPRKVADWLASILPPSDLIDFGGGEGRLAELLRDKDIRARSYDPFYGAPTFPEGQFDVVTAFEVVEHVPDQKWLFSTLKMLCRPQGMIIFSTLTKDEKLTGDWWYASARNGHVSLHSNDSLGRIMAATGLSYISLSREVHIAVPEAASLRSVSTWQPIQISDRPKFRFVQPWSRMTFDDNA